jgi:hypothetical protein
VPLGLFLVTMWTMTVTFRLRFSTQPGQSLWLTGAHPLPDHPVPLRYVDEESWEDGHPADHAGDGGR